MAANTREILDAIIAAYRDGKPISIATVVGDNIHRKAIVGGTNDEPWRVEAERVALQMHCAGRRTKLDSIDSGAEGRLDLAIESVVPRTSLLILGAGHVGQAVALIGALAGYDVTVVDDRGEFLARSRFPNQTIRLLELEFAKVSEHFSAGQTTAIVIVTRGHSYDEVCLRQFIESDAAYIGMIGSRRRVKAVYDRLARSGVASEMLGRVHAPIGLTIGAVSPQEIGVAIVAQIIQTLNLRSPSPASQLRA
jgi:xanthine/CO dehydrogenase XdhC/CoxF family maturation factor